MIIGLPIWIALLVAAIARAVAVSGRRREHRGDPVDEPGDPADIYMDMAPGAAW